MAVSMPLLNTVTIAYTADKFLDLWGALQSCALALHVRSGLQSQMIWHICRGFVTLQSRLSFTKIRWQLMHLSKAPVLSSLCIYFELAIMLFIKKKKKSIFFLVETRYWGMCFCSKKNFFVLLMGYLSQLMY